MLLPVASESQAAHVDREAFRTTLRLPALRVPKQRCQEMLKRFNGCAHA